MFIEISMREKEKNHFLIDLEDLENKNQEERLCRIKKYIKKEHFRINKFLKLKELN